MAGELLKPTPPANTPAYRRLRDVDKVLALKLADDGLTQVQIAQRLGCSQSTVSEWLSKCQDTTAQATRYFKGQALRMAESVVRGPEHVQLKALQGLGVAAEQEQSRGVTVIVGGSATVQVITSPQVLSVQADTRLTERALSEPKG